MKTIPWFLFALLVSACASSDEGPSGEANAMEEPQPLYVMDMEGELHDLSATMEDGKAVALVFWQASCATCTEVAPALVEAAANNGEEILFIGVVPGTQGSVDEAAVEAKASELGLPYPQVSDRTLSLSERFGVESTPTIVVLGDEGRVLYQGDQPPEDWSALTSDKAP